MCLEAIPHEAEAAMLLSSKAIHMVVCVNKLSEGRQEKNGRLGSEMRKLICSSI